MPLLVTLLLLSSALAPEVRLIRLTGDGLSEQDLSASEARLFEELQLMGAAAKRYEAPDAECLADEVCRGTLAGDAVGLLDVQLFRVGPILQVNATLYAANGTVLHAVERSVNAEGVAQTASLLGPDLAPHVRKLVQDQAQAQTAPEQPPQEETEGSSVLPWVVLGSGLGVVGLGALAAVAGVALSAQQTLSAYTATTPGDAKATALVLAPTFAGAAVFGVAIAAVGGGISVLALFVE